MNVLLMENIKQSMAQFEFVPTKLIKRFDTYSDSLKVALIKRSIDNLNANKIGLSVGRLVTLTTAYFVGPPWLFLVGLIMYIMLWDRQRSINIFFEKALNNNNADIKKVEHEVVINGITRNIALCVTFVGFSAIDTPLGATCAAIFLVGHLFSFIYLNAQVPRAVILGSIPTIITIIFVTALKIYSFGGFAAAIPMIYFMIFTYSIGHAIINDALTNFELNESLQQKATVLERALENSRAEEELRRELELHVGVGVYSWLFENNKYSWSPGAYKLFGREENLEPYDAVEFMSRVTPDTRDEFLKVMHNASKDKTSFICNYRFQPKEGEIKQLVAKGSPIYNDDGIHIGMTGMVIDQTEAYLNLKKLSENQELLNLALNNSESIILVYDIDSKKVNAYGALDAIGVHCDDTRSSDEFLDKLYSFLPPEDFKAVALTIEKTKNTGNLESTEVKIRHPDGRMIDVHYSVIFVKGKDGDTDKLISYSTNITKEVERRNTLSKALIEAKRASRVKTEFLANMSHEIRTPLNGVIAVVGVLGKTKLSKNQREMVELIENSGDNLRDILNDVLDIARIESEKLEIEKTPFQLDSVLKTLTALFNSRAQEKGLELAVELPANGENQFIGDANRIRQILSNLLSNAIKFTNEGKVTLRASIAKGKKGDNLRTIKFEVEDTGTGISRTNLSRLFERFEQIDGTITRQYGGSGLGLSISKSLAELMGGKIGATSKLGFGSRFKFELPLETTIIKTNNTQENAAISAFVNTSIDQDRYNDSSKISILAVDDNPTNLRIIEMILAPLDIDLTLCENGLEAAECFAQAKYDLVLMDLQMPVLDGLSAMRIMRVQEQVQMSQRTPIIAVSASAMTHNVREAKENGADFLVAKPFTPASLLNGIERALKLADNETDQFSEAI